MCEQRLKISKKHQKKENKIFFFFGRPSLTFLVKKKSLFFKNFIFRTEYANKKLKQTITDDCY
jgi:hypothetical protein